jgi:hypothetical protein
MTLCHEHQLSGEASCYVGDQVMKGGSRKNVLFPDQKSAICLGRCG